MLTKRMLIFFIGVILLLSFAVAVNPKVSTIEITPLTNTISLAEEATFKINIINNADVKQRYSLYSLQDGQGWNIYPSPLRDKILEIAAGRSYATTVIVKPIDSFVPGIYNVPLTLESDLGERQTQYLKLYLSPDRQLNYLPTLKVTVDMDEKIKPRQPVSVKLFLENRNPLDLTDLKVRVQSEIPEFATEVAVPILPLDKRTVEFTLTPGQYQQPKEYTIFFVFEHDGQTAKIVDKKIEILPLTPPFTVDIIDQEIFLKRFTQLEVNNPGNLLNTQEVKLPVSFFESLIMSSEGQIKTEEDQRYLVWELSLQPNESKILNVVTNYRLLLYIFIFGFLFCLFYWYVQSPLLVKKSVLTANRDEDGAISEIKISLEVRNNSSKILHHVHIIDLVPGIVNVDSNLELGTIKPHEVKQTKHGTKVIWFLEELDAHEHRLITYKVKAKLNILGAFSLPRATVEYAKRKGGRNRKAYSNICKFGN